MKDYTTYTVEDFVLDESFVAYVRGTDPIAAQFWEAWLARHPQGQPLADEAARIISRLSGSVPGRPAAEAAEVWRGIQSGMARPVSGQKAAVKPRTVSFPTFLRPGRWAAVLTGLLLLSGIGYFGTGRYYLTITQGTAYGELRTLTLPDGSTVTLNGNTRLRYARFWPAGEVRQVWLEGEAYFDVRHLGGEAPRTRFLVHTARAEVEVLGTRFNVSGRKRRTRVVLESGKVQLTVRQATRAERLVMQPGDLVELAGTGRPALRQVNPKEHAAWRENRIVLDNTSLAEIAQLIEDNYGRRVVVRAGAATGKRLSGSVPSNNLNVLLKGLSRLFDLNITRKADQIVIDVPPANTH